MPLLNAKSIKLSFAIAMFLPVSLAVAESGPSGPIVLDTMTVYKQTHQSQDYQYGMDLDIAEVISTEYFPPKPNYCGIIPAQLTYKDSKGDLHAVRYLYPETKGCRDN